MSHYTIIILDYGSQYTQLIARKVRQANIYCEIFSWRDPAEQILPLNPKGFILSGGPNSVYAQDAPTLPKYVLESGLPILGICYGMQLLAHHLGGRVGSSVKREYGPTQLVIDLVEDPLFQNWRQSMGLIVFC